MTEQKENEISISIENENIGRAAQGAAELRDLILQDAPTGFDVKVKKERHDTQDFGATLVAILGTGAAIAIAEGIRAYLAKSGDTIKVRTRNGEISISGDSAKNMDSESLAKSIEAL